MDLLLLKRREFRRCLIGGLLIAALFPAMFTGRNILEYLPVFAMLLFFVLSAVFEVRDDNASECMKCYIRNNCSILTVVIFYIIVVAIAALREGSTGNVMTAAGTCFVLFTIHFMFPVAVREKEDLVFTMKVFFAIGLVASFSSLLLLILKFSSNVDFGVYPASLLQDKAELLGRFGVIFVAKGVFVHPNLLGMLVAFFIPVVIFFSRGSESSRVRILICLSLATAIFALAVSAALISMLPVFVILVWHLFSSYRRASFNVLRLVILAEVLVTNFVIIAGLDLKSLGNFPVTSRGRVELWTEAMKIIRDNKLYGIGMANTANVLPHGWSAHNTFFETALGSGIGAMILYAIYLVMLLNRVRFSHNESFPWYMLFTFFTFATLQLFETLMFGGLSIVNFYFLVVAVSYLFIISQKKNSLLDFALLPLL